MLTIAICGLIERLPCQVFDKLYSQKTDEVEILLIFDNRQLTLGEKRNIALDYAKGGFIAFVDDDDDITDDYIETLLEWAKKGNFDVLTFKTAHYIDGVFNRDVLYSTTKGNRDREDHYIRWANAICMWRLDFAKSIGYGQVTFGEDSDFGSRASKKRPKEVFINKVLYKHLWSSELSTGEVENKGEYKLTYQFPRKDLTDHLIVHSII